MIIAAFTLTLSTSVTAQARDIVGDLDVAKKIMQEYVRNYPIYRVYKNGHEVYVSVDLQWFIRDLANEHGYCERIIFGMILEESTFNPGSIGDGGRRFGLAQLSRWWLRSPHVEPYRLTEYHRERDLLEPFYNLLTTIEIWNYARSAYGLDMNNDDDVDRLLRWHNTGRMPDVANNWHYVARIRGFADELVELKLPTEFEITALEELLKQLENKNEIDIENAKEKAYNKLKLKKAY